MTKTCQMPDESSRQSPVHDVWPNTTFFKMKPRVTMNAHERGPDNGMNV